MKVYVVKDEKVGYMNVVVDHNDEVAKINFGRGFHCEKPELGRLSDYSLYSVADFNVDNGLTNVTEPKFVINGLTAYNDFVSLMNSIHVESLKGVEENADPDMEKESC